MAEEENIRFIECGDDRFEIIKRAKEHIINATNIESSPEEMKVLNNFLFRCWQMGWLKNDFHQLEKENEGLKKNLSRYSEKIAEQEETIDAQDDKINFYVAKMNENILKRQELEKENERLKEILSFEKYREQFQKGERTLLGKTIKEWLEYAEENEKLKAKNEELKKVCDFNCPVHKLATHNTCLTCTAVRNSPHHDLKNVTDEELQKIIKDAEVEMEM